MVDSECPCPYICDGTRCTAIFNGKQCTNEPIVRRGVRCDTGCFGEGVFDYACEYDIDPVIHALPEDNMCVVCDKHNTLTYFDVQWLSV